MKLKDFDLEHASEKDKAYIKGMLFVLDNVESAFWFAEDMLYTDIKQHNKAITQTLEAGKLEVERSLENEIREMAAFLKEEAYSEDEEHEVEGLGHA